MKKIIQTILIVLSLTKSAFAHNAAFFHSHPHGEHLNPTDTTILLILIAIVLTMLVAFIILIYTKLFKRQ